MSNKVFTKIALIMTMAAMMAFSVTACGNKQNTDSGQQIPNPEEVTEQTEDSRPGPCRGSTRNRRTG